jgi:hypothetical protein
MAQSEPFSLSHDVTTLPSLLLSWGGLFNPRPIGNRPFIGTTAKRKRRASLAA